MKRWLGLAAVLVSLGLLVGMVAVGCGQGGGGGTPVADPTAQALSKQSFRSDISTSGTNSGTISGKITNMLTGDPVSGVAVAAGGKSATTDSSGNYSLSGATEGTVTFATTHPDFENISVVCNSSGIGIGLLPKNRSPKGTIYGTVKDASGDPVIGAAVIAASSTYFQESSTIAITGADGSYTMSTEAGDVVVVVGTATPEGSDMRTNAVQYAKVTLAEGSSLEVNLQFPADQGTISGNVNNTSSPLLTNGSVGAMLIVGNAAVGMGGYYSSSSITSYSFAVPPTQGSDIFLLLAGGGSNRYYWDADYTAVSAGQTVTKNFTIGNPVQMVSPLSGATVTSTPTLSWEAGDGNNFDVYLIKIFQGSSTTGLVRNILTEGTSYTLTSAEALAAGSYGWFVAGYEINGYTSISSFNLSELTIMNGSQDTLNGSFIVP